MCVYVPHVLLCGGYMHRGKVGLHKMCVCVREGESGRQDKEDGKDACKSKIRARVCVFMYVHAWERKTQRERKPVSGSRGLECRVEGMNCWNDRGGRFFLAQTHQSPGTRPPFYFFPHTCLSFAYRCVSYLILKLPGFLPAYLSCALLGARERPGSITSSTSLPVFEPFF